MIARIKRSRVVLWLVVTLIAPVLGLQVFGGTTFLSHAHDGHGSHLHASFSPEAARHSADEHRLGHASGSATCSDVEADHGVPSESDQSQFRPTGHHDHPSDPERPGGLIISIPDLEQLLSRGPDLAQTLHAAQAVPCVLALGWAQPAVAEEVGSPGGLFVQGPAHLSSLTAAQRLVRTSCALLI